MFQFPSLNPRFLMFYFTFRKLENESLHAEKVKKRFAAHPLPPTEKQSA